VNIQDHLEKAVRQVRSSEKLDSKEDWEAIVEILYGAIMHYIACICEKRSNTHIDTHKGLARYLNDNGLVHLAELFREMDQLRLGRWYGGRGNGETVARAKEILEEIKHEWESLNK
jgi:hypothetical protein